MMRLTNMVNATLRFCFGCLEVAYKDCVGRGVEIGESTTSTCSTRSFRNDLMMQFLFSFDPPTPLARVFPIPNESVECINMYALQVNVGVLGHG
jgi:hypothetical protein